MTGTRQQPQQKQETPEPEPLREPGSAAAITATELFVIRSNLEAVLQQVEDLERKLRQSEKSQTNVVELKRKKTPHHPVAFPIETEACRR